MRNLVALLGSVILKCGCILLAVLLPLCSACGKIDDKKEAGDVLHKYYAYMCGNLSDSEEDVYLEKLNYLCNQELWIETNAYDAGHGMLIPMHYAFKSNNEEAISCFDSLFSAYIDVYFRGWYGEYDDYTLGKAHFIYLSTQYLVLTLANRGSLLDWQKELFYIAERYATDYLFESVAIYGVEDNAFIKIKNVLNGKTYKMKYYSAIVDAELFNLSILCDCHIIDKLLSLSKSPESLSSASDIMFEVLTNENLNIELADGGWLFQPGVYADHKDFLYAGNEKMALGLEEKRIDDIVWDSSHFCRMPAFITSAIVSQSDSEKIKMLENRLNSLANQMILHVLKKEVTGDYWYATTFMDGRNGVYRYDPESGTGYEGYDLSSTLFAGWWSLLRDSRITDVYHDLADILPLQNDDKNPYLGLDTKKNQNPYLVGNDAWDNGWFECIVWCAEQM